MSKCHIINEQQRNGIEYNKKGINLATENFFLKKQSWSKIKDEILKIYLKPYCAKVLSLNNPLVIVDCFAGHGRFKDGSDGSPLIVSNVINEIKSNGQVYQNKDIKAFFIEKKYFKELQNNLLNCSDCNVLEGTFEDNFEHVVALDSKTNIFLYIDPYGIKSLSFDIFNEVKKKNFLTTEFIMNFNSFGFLREGFRLLKYSIPDELNEVTFEHDERNSIEKMNIIANGDYWQQIIHNKNSNEISMHTAEEQFIDRYINEIKKIYKHVVNIPIKEKMNHLPKYHLIFGTNHHEGVKLMVDNMNKAWNEIRQTSQYNSFEMFAQPNYNVGTQFNLETEILKNVETKVHLRELILSLIEVFGVAYTYKNYIEKIEKLSLKSTSLFDGHKPKIRIIREYLTQTGKKPRDWDWNNAIYLERLL